MMIHDQRKPYQTNSCDILIGGEKIAEVDEYKYLGIIIDRNLRFDQLAAYVEKKVAKNVNFMY